MNIPEQKYVICWDLDETLGYFVEFGMFWEALQKNSPERLSNEDFFQILDLYPEFLRPNILKALIFLKNKKKKNKNIKVILYTNNLGPKSWARLIIDYFNHKLNYKLFDLIIPAFKANNKQISQCRTGHGKSYYDLLQCANIPPDTQVCFIDDQEHIEMQHPNVYYIHIKGYEHDLSFDEMFKRLENSPLFNKLKINNKKTIENIKIFLSEYYHKNKIKSDKSMLLDKIITKRLYQHLQQFFKDNIKQKTRKNKVKSKKRTFKIFSR